VNPVIIPSIDPIPLPAPVWLMQFLSGLTFVLHVFAMNLVLGGGLLAVAVGWIARRQERPEYTRLAGHIANVLPAATAMAITMGVPPLLFLQVLYGPLFYTSSVLIAWPWLAVVGLLLVGYYGYYYFSLKKGEEGQPLIWAGLLASILFILVGFIYTNNMTLMIQPERFGSLYRRKAHGLLLDLADPMLWPRYLHFFVGALAVSALLVMVLGLIHRKDARYSESALQFGGITFVGATLVQFGIGIWFLLSLRKPVVMRFMGLDLRATLIFGIAFLFALGAMIHVLVAALGRKPVAMTVIGAACIVVTIILMTLMRAIVRDAYLGEDFVVMNQPVGPQWVVVGIFLVLLVAGLAVVGWMLHAVVTKRGLARE